MTILDDIEKHFAERLHQTVIDVFDTCDRVDIDAKDSVVFVLASLARELVAGAISMRMNEEDFLMMCQIAYRETVKAFRKTAR